MHYIKPILCITSSDVILTLRGHAAVKAESDHLHCYFEAVSFISDQLWLWGSTAVLWNVPQTALEGRMGKKTVISDLSPSSLSRKNEPSCLLQEETQCKTVRKSRPSLQQ